MQISQNIIRLYNKYENDNYRDDFTSNCTVVLCCIHDHEFFGH